MITVRGALPEEYSAAIFFDNDPKKIHNVAEKCPVIQGQRVPETASEIHPLPLNFPPLKTIVTAAGGEDRSPEETALRLARGQREDNKYVKYLRAMYVTTDYYDPVSGINPVVHRPIIEEWLHSLESPNTSVVLIDWDRTMTVIEGYYNSDYDIYKNDPRFRVLFSTFTKEEFYEDILRYLLGGDERLAALRSIFSIIGDLNIHICILTNNGSCPNQQFKDLIDKLMPPSVENLFIACSKPAPFNGHKGNKLKSIEQFRTLCNVVAGGGYRSHKHKKSRKRKTRIKHKHRRTRGRFNKN